MVISALKVLELNETYNLITDLCERERESPEGVGLDIRVGAVYRPRGSGFLGIEQRITPETEKVASIGEDGNKRMVMRPGEYLLVETMERVNVPEEKIDVGGWCPVYLMPVVYPRSTLQRCGVALFCTKTDPGYSGSLIFGLKNEGGKDFEFELGARMFNIVFETVIGEIKREYSGQHQDGRVTSGGQTEVQR